MQILAGASPQHLPPPAGVAFGPQGEWFQAIAGTSMSSPHIAGAGALIKALHPDWTPGQIKSALMTTAWTQWSRKTARPRPTRSMMAPAASNLNVAGDPGLTFDATPAILLRIQTDLWNANYPSVYVPVHAGRNHCPAHGAQPVAGCQHLERSKSPRCVSGRLHSCRAEDYQRSAGGDAPFNIVIDGRDVPVGQVRMATLYLTQDGGSPQAAHPDHLRPQAPVVTLAKTCSPATVPGREPPNCTITALNSPFDRRPSTSATNCLRA